METPKLTIAASCGGCVYCVAEKTHMKMPLPLTVFKLGHFLFKFKVQDFWRVSKHAALQCAEMGLKVSTNH